MRCRKQYTSIISLDPNNLVDCLIALERCLKADRTAAVTFPNWTESLLGSQRPDLIFWHRVKEVRRIDGELLLLPILMALEAPRQVRSRSQMASSCRAPYRRYLEVLLGRKKKGKDLASKRKNSASSVSPVPDLRQSENVLKVQRRAFTMRSPRRREIRAQCYRLSSWLERESRRRECFVAEMEEILLRPGLWRPASRARSVVRRGDDGGPWRHVGGRWSSLYLHSPALPRLRVCNRGGQYVGQPLRIGLPSKKTCRSFLSFPSIAFRRKSGTHGNLCRLRNILHHVHTAAIIHTIRDYGFICSS